LDIIDLSSTKICVSSFPPQWIQKRWISCNLDDILYPCLSPFPKNCVRSNTSGCIQNLKCFVDQCATGEDNCTEEEYCTFQEDIWSYTCSLNMSYPAISSLNSLTDEQQLALKIFVPILIVLISIAIALFEFYRTGIPIFQRKHFVHHDVVVKMEPIVSDKNDVRGKSESRSGSETRENS